MSVPEGIPAPLAEVLAGFEGLDRARRAEELIEWADQLAPVPPRVATPPWPEAHHVERCESGVYVWAVDRPDGRLDFHFAVENPQGLASKALCAILADTCSGQPLAQVAAVPADIVPQLFGREVTMGKGLGLGAVVERVAQLARRRLADAGAAPGPER